MIDWPWHICLACAEGVRCAQHADGAPGETPYQTLTRWGSVQMLVRTEDAEEFRALLRRQARSDRLRIRTYAHEKGDLSYVLAQLADYKVSDEEAFERMREAIRDFSWEGHDDRPEAG